MGLADGSFRAGGVMEQESPESMVDVQSAIDSLTESGDQLNHDAALAALATAIFARYRISEAGQTVERLFSPQLPPDAQRFAAICFVRALGRRHDVLDLGDTARHCAALFDRTLQRDVYPLIGLELKQQTFEKLASLSQWCSDASSEAEATIASFSSLDQLEAFEQRVQQTLNGRQNKPLLTPMLPRALLSRDRIAELFKSARDFRDNASTDAIGRQDDLCAVCDDYEAEAKRFGSTDADHLLGGLARKLRDAVKAHFSTLEASKPPNLVFALMDKHYSLDRAGQEVMFRVVISNQGTGPARDLAVDEIETDGSTDVDNPTISLGTLNPRTSFYLDIPATVTRPSEHALLTAIFSWSKPDGTRDSSIEDFNFIGQETGIDWASIEQQDPYSLEPVVDLKDLVGRKVEVNRLVRLASSTTGGSSYLFGQKRVGKTSIANAVGQRLEGADPLFVVINISVGEYASADAPSTMRQLGGTMVRALQQKIPFAGELPMPDFSEGLSPLSRFIDEVLQQSQAKLLFILDEFDELPIDLYRRTPLGDALFLPIRTISNKRRCGFLLVGGERMEQIINSQGDRLNKFHTLRVDSFDRSTDWLSFADLIRRPVEHWLTISDSALERIYEESAGNPYFAKVLANQVADQMAEARDSYVSESDAERAIANTRQTIQANAFVHFWQDGIFEDPEKAEQIALVRRDVLLAAGRAFRKSVPALREEVTSASIGPTKGTLQFDAALRDLISRGILTDSDGLIDSKIPLFREWLMNNGVSELLASFSESEILTSRVEDEERAFVKDEELMECAQRLGHYRGQLVTAPALRVWLNQFGDASDQRLMFKLLGSIKPYQESYVRAKMKEAFDILTRGVRYSPAPRERVRKDTLVTYLDTSPAKSGATYVRLFVSENQLSADSAISPGELSRAVGDRQGIKRLVLIDDFVGTGSTALKGLTHHNALLKAASEQGATVVFFAVAGFGNGRERITRFAQRAGLDINVYFCDELGAEDQIFGEQSRFFTDPTERDRAKIIAESKGIVLEPRHPLGYEDLQAGIVFSQSCPNNTLPILWSSNKGWKPLFPRN